MHQWNVLSKMCILTSIEQYTNVHSISKSVECSKFVDKGTFFWHWADLPISLDEVSQFLHVCATFHFEFLFIEMYICKVLSIYIYKKNLCNLWVMESRNGPTQVTFFIALFFHCRIYESIVTINCLQM